MIAIITPFLLLLAQGVSHIFADDLPYPQNSDMAGHCFGVLWVIGFPVGLGIGAACSLIENGILGVAVYLLGMALLIAAIIAAVYASCSAKVGK